jgi:hypothetical protein
MGQSKSFFKFDSDNELVDDVQIKSPTMEPCYEMMIPMWQGSEHHHFAVNHGHSAQSLIAQSIDIMSSSLMTTIL